MSFFNGARFPAAPSFGFISSPRYEVSVTRLAGGQEQRNRNWSRPLYRFTATIGPRDSAVIQELLEFWHAMGGKEYGFRFKDWADYKSCRVAVDLSPLDAPLVLVAGSPTEYQLTKRYTFGSRSQDRDITKPVASTVRVANESGVEQAAARWTLDSTNGRLRPLGTFVGTPTTWGGEFDTAARFDMDEFPVVIEDQAVHSVQIALMELRT